MESNQGIGVTMAQTVLALEQGHLLHVLLVLQRIEHAESVRDRLAVDFFNGREIRSRAFDLRFA